MPAADDTEQPRIAALRAEIAELEEELAATTRPRTRASLEAELARLRAELAGPEAGPGPASPQPTLHADQSGQSGGVSAGAGNTFGDHAHIGDVLAQHNYYGAEATDVVPLLRAYLIELSGSCNRLSLADADSVDPGQPPLDLQAVYVGLEVNSQVDLPPEDPEQLRERAISTIKEAGFGLEEFSEWYGATPDATIDALIQQLSPRERQRRLRAVESLAANRIMVLSGHPGSGKSSFVNFVSICLAGAWCDDKAWLDRLGDDWPHGPLLPIRVTLREFGAWVDANPTAGADHAGLLWRWLEQGAGLARLLAQHLRAALADGKAVLLLDGLDEVPLGAAGKTLRQVVAAVEAIGRGRGRVVVTCRALDYERPERQLADWPVEQIAPLSQPLREQLVEQWFATLEQLQRPTRGKPAELRDGLTRALQERPELRRLAGNPLLLTMMIRLQAHDGELPGERVALYRRSVDLLLLQWRRDAAGRVSLAELLELPQWSDSHLHRLLDRLAYVAHERGVSGDAEQGADLPRQLLLDTAAQFFALYDPDRDVGRAQTFLNYISEHGNGIIQRHDQQTYRFPHRTFQEYLAGRRLTSDEGWPGQDKEAEFVDRALACSARGPQWREAVLLAVSQYAIAGQIRPVVSLAEELLLRHRREGAGRDLLLAAEVLLEVGRERADERRPDLWGAVRRTIHELIEALNDDSIPRFPVMERVRAGFLLGELGDSRAPVAIEQWRVELGGLSSPTVQGYFCRVPAGEYQIGSADDEPDAYDDEKPQHACQLAHDLWIARFPITNAQWQVWVAEGGERAYYADDTDMNHPNQPVVAITWHSARAFCDWLSTQLADLLPTGYVFRLPFEAEWEVAARGTEARRYPWGNEWCEDCAATEEDQNSRGWSWTVPVGCYPAGAAACGALDLAGNVWEWTLDHWQSYPDATKPFTNEKLRVVRGGGYNSTRTLVRCGARNWVHPDFLSFVLGFRVVLAPQLAHLS